LRNCSQCGRVFAYRGNSLCSKCLDKAEDDFVLVRRYLQKHAGAGIKEIEENTGVDEQIIMKFMREGRLASESSADLLKCENCGCSIAKGRYCEKCLYDLTYGLKAVLPVPPAKKDNDISRRIRGTMYTRKS